MSGLLERAKAEGTPLIDPLDGENIKVTFVWAGEEAVPRLMGDFTGWQERPVSLEQAEPGIWTFSLELPADIYAEYSFFLKPDIEERYPDPFNPRKIWNGINAYNNCLGGPTYRPTRLTSRGAGVPRGALSEHLVETNRLLGSGSRKVVLYHPPTTEPVPLVIVWDGEEYLYRANLNVIVDNLIAEGSIRPLALAFVNNGESSRFVEYLENTASLVFILEKVLPLARERINLLNEGANPGIHGRLGASMGGLMALFGGLRYPEIFGRVLTQSGGFWVNDPCHEMLVFELIRKTQALPLKIWQDVGRLEGLLEGNRQMNALLKEKGYDISYTEFNGGHNYTMWANHVDRGLKFLYGR